MEQNFDPNLQANLPQTPNKFPTWAIVVLSVVTTALAVGLVVYFFTNNNQRFDNQITDNEPGTPTPTKNSATSNLPPQLAFAVSTQDALEGDKNIFILDEGNRQLISDAKECGKVSPTILSFSPSNKNLVFTCTIQNGNTYIIDLTNKRKKLLINKQVGIIKWTSNNEFYFVDNFNPTLVQKMNSDGTGLTTVLNLTDKTQGGSIQNLQISPNKQKILLSLNFDAFDPDDPKNGIYVFDLSNAELRRVIAGDHPVWVSNETFIFFDKSAFWKMKASGGELTKVVDTGVSFLENVKVNNGILLFTASGAPEKNAFNKTKSVFIFDLKNFRIKQVPLKVSIPERFAAILIYDLAEDGSKIAFRFFSTGGAITSPYKLLYTADLSSGIVEEATQMDEFALSAAWAY